MDDVKKGTQLLEVYALEIQMYTEQKNSKKLKTLYEQSLHIKSAIPHPLIMGVIRGEEEGEGGERGGKRRREEERRRGEGKEEGRGERGGGKRERRKTRREDVDMYMHKEGKATTLYLTSIVTLWLSGVVVDRIFTSRGVNMLICCLSLHKCFIRVLNFCGCREIILTV